MLVAQVSDIHARPDNQGLARLRRAVAWLEHLRPDALILSGDLVDDGWAEGYAAVELELRYLPCPCLAIPGNGDAKPLLRSTLPEAVRTDDGPLHFAVPLDDLVLVGLDVTVDGAAHGDASPHLDWLAHALERHALRRPLLFTHQHVFPSGLAPMDEIMCRGLDELAALIAASSNRPLMIASGHVHRPMSSLFAGTPAHICGSLCPANPVLLDPAREPPVTDPPMLMLHQVTGQRVVSHHVALG
jgi:3',5'-cyclic AMP phosphodiesterase CpdA